jgi:NADPH-dependent glutamate synthase beta subunit-like oxidoreductase
MSTASVPSIWTTGTSEVFKTGTWRTALPRHIRAPAPCHAACPVGGDIAEWIGRARARDFRGAWEILTRHNPFPAVAGRICHHPCEAACNRGTLDEPLAICRLERHVGDQALAAGWTFTPGDTPRDQRIAVIGGGPSGLSAAYHLRRRGYAVTLFESRLELGGVMRYGIPSYRLPRAVLDGEIDRIVALGIDVRCGEPIRAPEEFATLREQFDAIYVAVGAGRPKRLRALDYAQPWVMDGAEYLARTNAGEPSALGRRVVVIGGGSAAFDVARSARRAGHEVTMLALESVAQLPAQPEEVAEALEERIALIDGAMLVSANAVASVDGAEVWLACVRVRFEPLEPGGPWNATPIPGSQFALEADAIVTAIGQNPDLGAFSAGLDAEGGLLATDPAQTTSDERVFAGGDVASMARFVTEAIGMGKRAAAGIDRMLRGARRHAEANPEHAGNGQESSTEPIVEPAAINTFYHPRQPRATEARRPVVERLRRDAEVQLGFDLEQALAETGRCFSCGTCTECDNCVEYCPDLAVQRGAFGYVVLTDYCKGCGICVRECPSGSMKMVEEAR